MGIFEKIKNGLSKTRKNITGLFDSFTGFNDEFFDELEETLLLADLGAEKAVATVDKLRERVKAGGIRGSEGVKEELTALLTEQLQSRDSRLHLTTVPSIILMIGVNGVGKTTSIAKLAHMLKNEGKSVLLVAADTFRAAASEQLTIWSERVGVPIIKHKEGADPSAVIYDGCNAAKARGIDVVICDTAGRLQNKKNLMAELAKMNKVIDREFEGASRETLLVVDATTGKNAVSQAREFNEVAQLTGIILTKLDGTAKGGIVVTIADELDLPVKYIGLGEGMDDLKPFDPKSFAEDIFEG